MNSKTNAKSVIVEIICLLYILLFVYAAASKLLDFENFKVQVGQSPLLSAFAGWVSWAVPLSELIIALMLLIPKFRNPALFASFGLMSMFTVYIFIVLHYSSFVPCSCGGILEKMSWNIHMIFNIAFLALAAGAIILNRQLKAKNGGSQRYRDVFKWFAGIAVFSTAAIVILYIWSDRIMHYENPFIRRYPNHAATALAEKDIKFNSYYFAGTSNGRIYLGNSTAPLQLLSFDMTLNNSRIDRITFDPGKIPFKMVRIAVKDKYFYLKDGSVPVIFRGVTADWKINKKLDGIHYFDQAEPIDSTAVVFRSNNGKNLANILGVFKAGSQKKIEYKETLLQKQIDGVFDTDGKLLYAENPDRIIYLYYYRNEFIVAGKEGDLKFRGNTIDTITKAKIKVSYLENHTVRKMSAPPLIVNANAAVCRNLLFVYSKIKGKHEIGKLWDQACIIDVYDLTKNTYLLSFPVYNIGSQRLKNFVVTPSHLYGLIGSEIVVYDLKPVLKKEMKSADLIKD
ncbi:MauE/DoxX family redox-associated membrane protein [Flavobacterium sp. FlaQc-28]|uniref:MauE/DoxX family redox-associated membrane protein n=1 Tax=Flavobacterium sp. FlaQc-28 TaxID=3374178 RepID=UPI00375726E1